MSTTTEEIRTLADDEVATVSGGQIEMFGTLVHAMYFVGLMVPEILTTIVERARDDPWQN